MQKATDKDQPILVPLYSLTKCEEILDKWADIVEHDDKHHYKMVTYGIMQSDGMVLPIVAILN